MHSRELGSQSINTVRRGVLGMIENEDAEDSGYAQPIRRGTTQRPRIINDDGAPVFQNLWFGRDRANSNEVHGSVYTFDLARLLIGNIEPSDEEDFEYEPQPLPTRRRVSDHSRVNINEVKGSGFFPGNTMVNNNMVTSTEGALEHLEVSGDASDGLSLPPLVRCLSNF